MHGLVSFMRTMHHYKTPITYKNLTKILKKIGRQDSPILNFVVENKIMELLIENHKSINVGLTLKDIYPKEVDAKNAGSYHGSFGMVALGKRKLGSKKYSEKVYKLLDANKIAKFKY